MNSVKIMSLVTGENLITIQILIVRLQDSSDTSKEDGIYGKNLKKVRAIGSFLLTLERNDFPERKK